MSNGRHNYGGQSANLRHMGSGAIDLSAMANSQAQQESAINQIIGDTAKGIYSMLIARMEVPPEGGAIDVPLVRRCAAFAVACAPYYAEALGVVKIGSPQEKPVELPEPEGEKPL